MGIYLPGAGTLGYVVWPGAGIAGSQDIPPGFYPPYANVAPSHIPPPPALYGHFVFAPLHLATLPLLPIWMSVASLNPWLSDFHTALFFDTCG